MAIGLKPIQLFYRDGTAQRQRFMEALNPGFVSVDERSLEDLLLQAQAFAKELRFFDENNRVAGNWEGFLLDDLSAYQSSNEERKAALRKRWITDILAYLDDPGRFALYPEKTRAFSKPHLALFISFLQLLGFVKDQLNGFTKKHLDFFYLEVLGLSKKKAVPDLVNVIIELAGDVSQALVENGTLLYAGKDSLGKDLLYKTCRDTVISQANATAIKTLFVDKKITGLAEAIGEVKDAKFRSEGDADEEFYHLFKLALGEPGPGDDLPLYKAAAEGKNLDLAALYADLTSAEEARRKAATDYINEALFLTTENFSFIIKTYQNERAGSADWDRVYHLLDAAYKAKARKKRQQKLRQIREADNLGGFYTMLKYAFGEPNQGDDLPLYKAAAEGKNLDLAALYADLTSVEEARLKAATAYINDELLLSVDNFKSIYLTYRNKNATPKDWDQVYELLEEAERKKQNVALPSPTITGWRNIYAIHDSRASAVSSFGQEGEANRHFNTFGKFSGVDEKAALKAVSIGFALSSPQLVLREGRRTITLTLAIREETPVAGRTPEELNAFTFFLSHEKGWRSVAAASITTGRFITGSPVAELIATVGNNSITLSGDRNFDTRDDSGRIVVDKNGVVYRVKKINDAKHAELTPAGQADNRPVTTSLFNADAFYSNALQVNLELDENFPPVLAPGEESELIRIKSDFPVLCMVLNNAKDTTDYPLFKDWKIEKVKVSVAASNIKNLFLQNDNSVLNYKKPFEPFGLIPHTGNALYFAHPELCEKQLDTLQLRLNWMNPPANFAAYYGNYAKVLGNPSVLNENTLTNSAFKAVLRLMDKNAVIPLAEQAPLFTAGDARQENLLAIRLEESIHRYNPAYYYRRNRFTENDPEVINWDRYFSLELGSPDFQHDLFPTLLTRQALADAATRALTINPPYTPKLKSLTADYTASFEVNVSTGSAAADDRIFHLTPFGYKPLVIRTDAGPVKRIYFLPYFENEGELYIGLSALILPQNLSLLFQMAEGSANPDLDPLPVNWTYLSNNEWKDLDGAAIVVDTTNGLLNTGTIELQIPGDATNNNTLLNGGLHWVRASIPGNADAIPDTVDIRTQVVDAAFFDQGNDDEHLQSLLPAGSISATVDSIPEISKIIQPYTSSKGKPAEKETMFYNRVSERLRHKARALTMWDYERLVLEQFPEVYKVKCMPGEINGNTANLGTVDVIVIPDIKGKLPFNPFQPKVPANTILQIQQYLDQRAPAFASVNVKNPSYLQIKTRFAVKMKEGYNEGFFLGRLQEELKRFLAPWAYDEGADIVLGGKVYANVIVNFIAERPYVDYVAGMKLFQSEDGEQFVNARTLNKGENIIQAGKPDVILVSALDHEIDVIRESGYEEKSFEGVGYLQIGLDFEIR